MGFVFAVFLRLCVCYLTVEQSTIRASLFGQETTSAPPSGIAGFRWLMDASLLQEHPELNWLLHVREVGASTDLLMITGPDERVLILYPCRSGKIINLVGIHTDRRNQETSSKSLYYPFFCIAISNPDE